MVRVAMAASEGHVPSSLSVLDIIWVLHNKSMCEGDIFLLSKAHASLALYVVLEQIGRIPSDWIDRFCEPGAELLGHPERRPECGIHATTGSLGHGAAISVGLALAKKIRKEEGRIFCVVGDGEAEEGVIYEAMHIASRLNLSNLVWVIDNNQTSPNRIDAHGSLSDKFLAFGWFVMRCNGHDTTILERMLEPFGGDAPCVLIADTVKGKGIAAMEADPQQWHHKSIPREMLGLEPA